MELEVSKKVREAIKAKLVELGCHVDDELPDYIMILIANRRSNQEIESDLGLFLTDNTKKFVTWLTHVLKKLEQVTASDSVSTTEKEADVQEATIRDGKSHEKSEVDGKKDKKEEKLKRRHSSNKSPNKKSKKPEKKDKRLENKEKDVENTEQGLERKEKIVENTEKESEQNRTEQVVEKTEKSSEKVAEESEKSLEKVEEIHEDGKLSTTSVPDHDLVSKKKTTIQRNYPMKTISSSARKASDFISFEPVKLDIEANNQNASDEVYGGHDTLILDTGENEFSENVEELRRIALESQKRKRKDNEDKKLVSKNTELSSNRVHQRKLITSILMSRVNEDNDVPKSARNRPISSTSIPSGEKHANRSSDKSSDYYETRHSSKNSSHSKSGRHENSPISFSRRVLRSPRRQERRSVERHYSHSDDRRSKGSNREVHSEKSPISVFSRIGNSSRKSRTRSRSPIRKLTSKIGNVIRRSHSSSGDESPIRNSVSSVIKVTERPRRDLQLSNSMLLRAVADAQQSIIKSEQNSPAKPKPEEKVKDICLARDQSRKRMSDENTLNMEVISYKKRFTDFPEVNTSDFYEEMDQTVRRISVKERLGVKHELHLPRIPVRERLGIIPNHPQSSPMHIYENETYSPSSDYKIMVNVSDETSAINGKQRNVVLATSDTKQRISIRVNNNSEEDSSSDESMTSTEKSPKKYETSTNATLKDKDTYETDFQLAISEEDKLPEVPMDSEQEEYEFEEIVEEVEDPKEELESAADGETTQELSQTSTVDSQRNYSIIINKRPTPAPVILLKSNLPDLRSMMSKPSVVNGSAGVSGLKCKFWPKCQFKDKCIYEHPACKYSPCKNKDCIYKHDNFVNHENFESKPKPPAKVVCKFYPKCTSMNCKFHHPSPCRFGVGCTDSRCENYHPGVTLGIQKLKAKGVKLLPQANQLKWVKK